MLFPLDRVHPNYEGFEDFWRAYPRKEARKDAQKAWNQLQPSAAVQSAILDALDWQRGLKNWQESKRYIPLPASYLRGERWMDENTSERVIDRRTDWEKAKDAGLLGKRHTY